MKRAFILIPLFLSFCFIADSQNETIYAEVNGNTATIWQTGTERKCGSIYEMLITLDDFHLQWLQLFRVSAMVGWDPVRARM